MLSRDFVSSEQRDGPGLRRAPSSQARKALQLLPHQSVYRASHSCRSALAERGAPRETEVAAQRCHSSHGSHALMWACAHARCWFLIGSFVGGPLGQASSFSSPRDRSTHCWRPLTSGLLDALEDLVVVAGDDRRGRVVGVHHAHRSLEHLLGRALQAEDEAVAARCSRRPPAAARGSAPCASSRTGSIDDGVVAVEGE